MELHQRRIVGRMADEIERHRGARLLMLGLLGNIYGLFESAEDVERALVELEACARPHCR